MYSTCIFCHSDLGANESVEHFPVGRRLAFDAARGRLWVVCRKCERWNLSPLDERWEAIEECERLFSATRTRVSTDNIGLARMREGSSSSASDRRSDRRWRRGDTAISSVGGERSICIWTGAAISVDGRTRRSRTGDRNHRRRRLGIVERCQLGELGVSARAAFARDSCCRISRISSAIRLASSTVWHWSAKPTAGRCAFRSRSQRSGRVAGDSSPRARNAPRCSVATKRFASPPQLLARDQLVRRQARRGRATRCE